MRFAAASAGHFSPLTPLARFLTSGGLSVGPNKPASVLKYTTIDRLLIARRSSSKKLI
jgi:hypothetical protein